MTIALVLAVTACSGDGDAASPVTTDGTSATSAASRSTTIVAETDATASTASGELQPLDLAISIHVEGFDDRNPAVYTRHLEALEQVVSEAETTGITLTFELGLPFAEGARAAGDGWIARLPDRGQAVGVHADLGATPMPPRQFARRLSEHKALVSELLGAPVTHVSGVCSEGPWVEPIVDAGFEVATGMVEFCLKSLDAVPAGYDAARIESCRAPADCHGQAPTDMERKLHPWRTNTSADWLTPDPGGELWLVAGESGRTLDDVDEFASTVADYVAAREPGRTNSLVMTISVGAPPAPGFITDLAAAVVDMADSIRWVSVADLAR